jgi:hypothetical protein
MTTIPPSRHPSRAPLMMIAALAVVTTIAVAATLRYVRGGGLTTSGVTAHPLLHVPHPTGSLPPLGANFSLTDAHAMLATPCPVTTPTGVPTATPTGTPLPAALPACGNGQRPGPRCYTTLPGTPPTQDQVREAMYNLVTANGFNNFSLIEAFGWQESGWQENVVACDGGVGVMQLQPETTAWLNQNDGTNYDPKTLDGNIHLGVAMVMWLYTYYIPFCNQGMPAGQTCTWDTVWPGATDGATVRQIIISSYNQGIGTTAKYGIQNWSYVNNVIALRQQFLAAEQSG